MKTIFNLQVTTNLYLLRAKRVQGRSRVGIRCASIFLLFVYLVERINVGGDKCLCYLHTMIIKSERRCSTFPNEMKGPLNDVDHRCRPSLLIFLVMHAKIRDKEIYYQMQNGLVEHQWAKTESLDLVEHIGYSINLNFCM